MGEYCCIMPTTTPCPTTTPLTCASFYCPTPWIMKPSPATIVCSKACTKEHCCIMPTTTPCPTTTTPCPTTTTPCPTTTPCTTTTPCPTTTPCVTTTPCPTTTPCSTTTTPGNPCTTVATLRLYANKQNSEGVQAAEGKNT